MGSRSSTTSSLPPWAYPTALTLLGGGIENIAPGTDLSKYLPPQGRVPFDLKSLDPALLQKVAPFSDAQRAGLDVIEGGAAPASAALAGQGAGELSKTISGAYLDPATNPFLRDTYGTAAKALTDEYSLATAPGRAITAARAGGLGGSADQQTQGMQEFGLGENLADLATRIYGGNYANERAAQLGAVSAIPGAQAALAAPGEQLLKAGTMEQQQTQTGLDVAKQNAEMKEAYPSTLLSYLTNLMQSVTGAGGVSTVGTSK